jgi:cell division septation protein DedD
VVAGPAYYAQAGAFASRANAELLAERLRGAGIAGVSVIESTVDGRTLFRVRAGPSRDSRNSTRSSSACGLPAPMAPGSRCNNE